MFNSIDFSSVFDILRIPIAYILQFCYWIGHNYMFALLLFAVIMQIILLPFAIKQQKNSIKQAKLAPKTAAIRDRYAGRNDQATQQKIQQETMDLYQRENFNPMGGCLPLLIQFPILFALFRVITYPLHYLSGVSSADIAVLTEKARELGLIAEKAVYPQIEIIKALASKGAEYTTNLMNEIGVTTLDYSKLPNFTLFGGKIDLSVAPKESGVFSWMMLIPVITVVALIFSQWLTKKFTYQDPSAQQAQNNMSMKIMLYAMPLLSGYFAYLYAAAIGIYWIFRNLLSLVQQIILAKAMPIPKFTEEDYKAAAKEMYGNKTKKKKSDGQKDPTKPKVRSLHHIDDDDDDYVSSGKVTRYDDDDDDTADPTKTSEAVAAPLKDDKGTKYEKKKNKNKD